MHAIHPAAIASSFLNEINPLNDVQSALKCIGLKRTLWSYGYMDGLEIHCNRTIMPSIYPLIDNLPHLPYNH